jgi:hypothetical protein
MPQPELSALIAQFTREVASILDAATRERVNAIIAGAFAPARRGPGRPPKNPLLGPIRPTPSRGRKARPPK